MIFNQDLCRFQWLYNYVSQESFGKSQLQKINYLNFNFNENQDDIQYCNRGLNYFINKLLASYDIYIPRYKNK